MPEDDAGSLLTDHRRTLTLMKLRLARIEQEEAERREKMALLAASLIMHNQAMSCAGRLHDDQRKAAAAPAGGARSSGGRVTRP